LNAGIGLESSQLQGAGARTALSGAYRSLVQQMPNSVRNPVAVLLIKQKRCGTSTLSPPGRVNVKKSSPLSDFDLRVKIEGVEESTVQYEIHFHNRHDP
jgi:hypothetical protein